jgi:starvation-inducible outer membrane lipoprotein
MKAYLFLVVISASFLLSACDTIHETISGKIPSNPWAGRADPAIK